jgi:hypothetical protein
MSAKTPEIVVVDNGVDFRSAAFEDACFRLGMPKGLFEGCTDRIKRIRFCAPGELRIRKIVSRSRMRPTGKHSSWKTGRMMQWESPNEELAFVHLDFRYDIQIYREQACEIVYIDDAGKEAMYYPDVDVLAMSGFELWEIKPKRFAEHADVKMRTEILTAELAQLNITYRMAYAEELGLEPRLQTMQKILDFSRRPVSSAELTMILNEVAQGRALTWGDACRGTYGLYGRSFWKVT